MDAAVIHRKTSLSSPRAHDTPLQRFGATLRQYRQQRQLSQPTLAAKMGIRASYISEIELGKRNISVSTLLRMTHVLRIPAAWLFEQVEARTLPALPSACDELSLGKRQSNDAIPKLDDLTTRLLLLGATIRLRRQQRGLFQAALAKMTDLTPTYIGEIERGKRNLSVLSLIRISDALELSVADLLALLETCQDALPPCAK